MASISRADKLTVTATGVNAVAVSPQVWAPSAPKARPNLGCCVCLYILMPMLYDPDLMPPASPLVSVAMTAFNSEKWIARALDSALLQSTNFPFEIVIGDDFSKDETLSIARSYQEQNPGVVRVLSRSENLGMQRNFYDTFEQCRGKYIAWLDADDYWTYPEKLAIQAHLLESDPSVNVCGQFCPLGRSRWRGKAGKISQYSPRPIRT